MNLVNNLDMERLNGVDLFSGFGRLSQALEEWVETRVYCENNGFNIAQLLSRMSRGELPVAPIWDNASTLKGDMLPFQNHIIKAGFPCQDNSVAGSGKGFQGERSVLFYQVTRLAQETKSPFIFLENVPGIRKKSLLEVGEELARLGYDCRWCIVSAREVGANHLRKRWFCLAFNKEYFAATSNTNRYYPNLSSQTQDKKEDLFTRGNGAFQQVAGHNRRETSTARHMANTMCERQFGQGSEPEKQDNQGIGEGYWWSEAATNSRSWWSLEPSVGRVANGGYFRRDEVRSLGNSVVKLQVQTAFRWLMGIEEQQPYAEYAQEGVAEKITEIEVYDAEVETV